MRRSCSGLTLLELTVVMLALMVVMAMGFQILATSGDSVARGLSLTNRGERLRILQKTMDRDLNSCYLQNGSADLLIGSPSQSSPNKTLLRAQILSQSMEDRVDLAEVIYTLEELADGSGWKALVRTLDPDLEPGKGPEADSREIFNLAITETLVWEATPESASGEVDRVWLKVTLLDERFKEFVSERQILLTGYAP